MKEVTSAYRLRSSIFTFLLRINSKMSLQPDQNVIDVAIACLLESNPEKKAQLTIDAFHLWKDNKLTIPSSEQLTAQCRSPDTPARSPSVHLVPPAQLKRRGRGGSLSSRQALLHSLVHIECCAIDLSWDIIARFSPDPVYADVVLQEDFFNDWITVAADEARHFTLLLKRLRETGTGMEYGDLPAHDGLWESARETAHSIAARLAVEHCVHEARGLDVLPQTINRFRAGGDDASADLLEHVIYVEEISHCAAGVKWLKKLHHHAHATTNISSYAWMEEARQYSTVQEWFHSLVRAHFHGALKPPFNDEARAKAGFLPDWYQPLSTTTLTTM